MINREMHLVGGEKNVMEERELVGGGVGCCGKIETVGWNGGGIGWEEGLWAAR